MQELSGSRHEEYAESRRRLGISAEAVWLASKPYGGGVVIVLLETENPEWALERALRELATSESPTRLVVGMGRRLHRLFSCDFMRLLRVAGGELLLAWREASDEGEQKPPEGS